MGTVAMVMSFLGMSVTPLETKMAQLNLESFELWEECVAIIAVIQPFLDPSAIQCIQVLRCVVWRPLNYWPGALLRVAVWNLVNLLAGSGWMKQMHTVRFSGFEVARLTRRRL